MACWTVVTVDLPDTELNRKAREALGLPLEGALSQENAQRVRTEAGVIKARREIRRLSPNAVIRRVGNQLKVSVTV